jgi:hypothetical protein
MDNLVKMTIYVVDIKKCPGHGILLVKLVSDALQGATELDAYHETFSP